MSNIEYSFYYSGPLLFRTQITNEEIKQIKKLIQKNTFPKENESPTCKMHVLNSSNIQKILQPYLNAFKEAHRTWYQKDLHDLKVVSCWANNMKSGDFIPPHIHTNCLFSSVLFINEIPKKIMEENSKYMVGKPRGPGSLNFIYSVSKTNQHIQEMNYMPQKGDYFIFPKDLMHWVFPFKSKCNRISIAANYK